MTFKGECECGAFYRAHGAVDVALKELKAWAKRHREQGCNAHPDVNAGRCTATSPGGVDPEGTLPKKGTRCGLPAGHDGDHTVLRPTGVPWFGVP